MNDFWTHWYFHIPNYVLALIMYVMLGRLVLGLFVPENWDNYIWRSFKAITDPAVRVIRYVTPTVLSHPVVLIFGVLWIMALRLGYLVLLINLGLSPLGGAA